MSIKQQLSDIKNYYSMFFSVFFDIGAPSPFLSCNAMDMH